MVGMRSQGQLSPLAEQLSELQGRDLDLQALRVNPYTGTVSQDFGGYQESNPAGFLLLRPSAGGPLVICLYCQLDEGDPRQPFNSLAAFLVHRGYSVLLTLPKTSEDSRSGTKPTLEQSFQELRKQLRLGMAALEGQRLVSTESVSWIGNDFYAYAGLRRGQWRAFGYEGPHRTRCHQRSGPLWQSL